MTVAVIVCLALPVILYGAFSLLIAVIDEIFELQERFLEQVSWYLPYFYVIESLSRRHGTNGYEVPGLDQRDGRAKPENFLRSWWCGRRGCSRILVRPGA